MRPFQLGWLFFRLGSLNELQYRANFFIQLLQSAVSVGTAIVVLALVYSHTDDLNGWSESELLVVMGIQILLGGVIRTSIQPNMQRLMEEVRDGKLDFALTKPEDSQVLVNVRDVRIGAPSTSSPAARCSPTGSPGSSTASARATHCSSSGCSRSAPSRSTASGS